MTSSRIDLVADALAAAWRSGGHVAPIAEESWPSTLVEAYQVQDALDARLDYALIGWKIGLTNRAGMKAHGLDHPVMLGRLYRHVTQDSPARFRFSDFRNAPMVEGEFAFRIGQDLPPRDRDYRESEIRDAVAAVIMTVDAVDTRWGVHPFDLTIYQGNADNACAGGFVIGAELDGWRSLDLASLPVELYMNGTLASGEAWDGERRCSLDELYAALHWAANELSRRGHGFKAGQVVSTGSPHEPVAAVPGAEVVIRYGDIGEIRATFDA